MADVSSISEKHEAGTTNDVIEPSHSDGSVPTEKEGILEAREIFHDVADGVKFRTVSWQRATIIFLKIQFAMSILAVPGALATLGAVGGALSIVGWAVLNTCEEIVQLSSNPALTCYMQTRRSS